LARSTPLRKWSEIPSFSLRHLAKFNDSIFVSRQAIAEADDVCAGKYRLFSWKILDAGLRPDWHRNYFTGEQTPPDCHWSELGDFAFGDIKGVWELSRFSWAISVARAYATARDERYSERFWQLFEHWLEQNPPNQGANWMCGQEASFRLIAAAFALDLLRNSPASTAVRNDLFARFVYATGTRIRANLQYALSQSNNHGVSECVGLLTAALCLPEASEAKEWQRTSLGALETQLSQLVYPDGGFAQHSAIYHRVLLHDLYWCVERLRSAGKEPPLWIIEAAQRALGFIDALMDPTTGRVPLYGANDGADILPLADAEFLDFRPTVQAGYALLYQQRRLPRGPWDEMAEWLSGRLGDDSLAPTRYGEYSPGSAVELRHFPDAGCMIWSHGESRLFFRCPTRFRHRPSQADMLHVDLTWRGHAIAHDAGTFSYNVAGQFAGALKDASVHNTLTVERQEPLRKVTRFLYLPWPRGEAGWLDDRQTFFGTHNGWRRLGVTHRREIAAVGPSSFEVRDYIASIAKRRVCLHWLLVDVPCRLGSDILQLDTSVGAFTVSWGGTNIQASIMRADPKSPEGWWAPHYYSAAPAVSLSLHFDVNGELEVITRFTPGKAATAAI
jgi:hypothetical protein